MATNYNYRRGEIHHWRPRRSRHVYLEYCGSIIIHHTRRLPFLVRVHAYLLHIYLPRPDRYRSSEWNGIKKKIYYDRGGDLHDINNITGILIGIYLCVVGVYGQWRFHTAEEETNYIILLYFMVATAAISLLTARKCRLRELSWRVRFRYFKIIILCETRDVLLVQYKQTIYNYIIQQ